MELNSNLETLFKQMEGFVSTKTVIGDPVHIDDVIIIPLVDVSFGVGAGVAQGSDKTANKGSEGGGGGIGAKLTPSAVVVITNGSAQLISVKNQESVNKLLDMVPGVISKLNIGSWFKKDKNAENGAGIEE